MTLSLFHSEATTFVCLRIVCYERSYQIRDQFPGNYSAPGKIQTAHSPLYILTHLLDFLCKPWPAFRYVGVKRLSYVCFADHMLGAIVDSLCAARYSPSHVRRNAIVLI